jgi:hypothetical protein
MGSVAAFTLVTTRERASFATPTPEGVYAFCPPVESKMVFTRSPAAFGAS